MKRKTLQTRKLKLSLNNARKVSKSHEKTKAHSIHRLLTIFHEPEPSHVQLPDISTPVKVEAFRPLEPVLQLTLLEPYNFSADDLGEAACPHRTKEDGENDMSLLLNEDEKIVSTPKLLSCQDFLDVKHSNLEIHSEIPENFKGADSSKLLPESLTRKSKRKVTSSIKKLGWKGGTNTEPKTSTKHEGDQICNPKTPKRRGSKPITRKNLQPREFESSKTDQIKKLGSKSSEESVSNSRTRIKDIIKEPQEDVPKELVTLGKNGDKRRKLKKLIERRRDRLNNLQPNSDSKVRTLPCKDAQPNETATLYAQLLTKCAPGEENLNIIGWRRRLPNALTYDQKKKKAKLMVN